MDIFLPFGLPLHYLWVKNKSKSHSKQSSKYLGAPYFSKNRICPPSCKIWNPVCCGFALLVSPPPSLHMQVVSSTLFNLCLLKGVCRSSFFNFSASLSCPLKLPRGAWLPSKTGLKTCLGFICNALYSINNLVYLVCVRQKDALRTNRTYFLHHWIYWPQNVTQC